MPMQPPTGMTPAAGVSRPGKMTQMFFNQGDAVDRLNQQAQLASTGETNRKPGQTQMFIEAASLEQQLVRKSRTGLYLGILAVVVVLAAIAAALYLPALMGPPGSDRASVAKHTQAMTLLRQDDDSSLLKAAAMLAEVLKTHPKYQDAEADRALALEFRWDALSVQVRALRDKYEALEKEVAVYNKRKEPADWMTKANADIALMKTMHSQYGDLVNQEEALGNEAFKLAQEVFKANPANLAAVRALAFYYGDQNDADKNGLFVKKYEKLLGKKDGWSELAAAELDASLPASAQKLADGRGHVTEALGRDPGLVRARYLKIAMDVGMKDEAAAKDDVSALAAAAPQHQGGKQLLDYLEETIARAQAEKAAEAAAKVAEPAPPPTPAPAPKGAKKAAPPPKKPHHR
jgi:hypothetical protein